MDTQEDAEYDFAGPQHSVSPFAGYLQPFPSWAALDIAANVLVMTDPVPVVDPVVIGALTKEEFVLSSRSQIYKMNMTGR